jgi:hypothetical protein
MRMKKRLKKPVRSRRSSGARKITRFVGASSARAIIVAVIAAGTAAVLIGAATSDVYPGKAAPKPSTAASGVPAAEPSNASLPVSPPAVEPAAQEPVQKSAAVTITGCLERSDESYRLKDTSGDGAPRGRSWKSGFLKKTASNVEVTDAANRVKLPAHVGQRVSVTGTIVDRQMRARSLQRVATTCSVKS